MKSLWINSKKDFLNQTNDIFSNFKTSLPHDQELNQQPEKNSTILGVKVDKERGDREEGKQGKKGRKKRGKQRGRRR